MVLDANIQKVRDFYGIWKYADWQRVSPEEVLAVTGVGPVTLDHIRLLLAAHGFTLAGDRTPEYWQEHLERSKVETQITEDQDTHLICPFTIVVDTAEQQPFKFTGITADSDSQYRTYIVKTVHRSLGRHPDSTGDYSIEGYEGVIGIERKSVQDFVATVTEFGEGGRLERFRDECQRLSEMDASAIVIEGSLSDVLDVDDSHRKLTASKLKKIVFRLVVALTVDYQVPIMFCDSRPLAERFTFRFFEKYWKRKQEERNSIVKSIESL